MYSVKRGEKYRLKLSDVVCPDRERLLQQITDGLNVTGEVVLLSDRGCEAGGFAIIEVEGILSPLIIPVDQLRSFVEGDKEQAREEDTCHIDKCV